ncbi:hypothetical protein KN63_08380 [Smithella sp. F21]|jgi:hypothetical protein|nr:hypothetical protein KN63_08380 [Smithella sp. F21]HBJ74583.1 hypothetical protein [Syntrophaceae bacterium]
MILHGIYENGVIKIKDKKLPMIRAEVDIIVKDKPWQRRIKKVKIKGEPVSETIIRARYEE